MDHLKIVSAPEHLLILAQVGPVSLLDRSTPYGHKARDIGTAPKTCYVTHVCRGGWGVLRRLIQIWKMTTRMPHTDYEPLLVHPLLSIPSSRKG